MLSGGGSYVVYTCPKRKQITIVVEKLEGNCLRCAGAKTTDEQVDLSLAGFPEMPTSLSLWMTNQTNQFVHLGDIPVVKGTVSIQVARDSIYTLSTTTGQQKASVTNPPSEPFPFPYADDFESSTVGAVGRYFADDGGSFTVDTDPKNSSNKVLKQWVQTQPGVNAWLPDMEPVTITGNAQVGDHTLSVKVSLQGHQYGGVCGRLVTPGLKDRRARDGYCLYLWSSDGQREWYWQMFAALNQTWKVLDEGDVDGSLAWHELEMEMSGEQLQATVDGKKGKRVTDTSHTIPGYASLNSWWGHALFDDFSMVPTDPEVLVTV